MTRLIIGAGHEVVAVEPDPQMRQRLAATTPAANAVEGSAESMPLADGSLDGAVAAQAYHWFDRDRAHAELARVIRPGGVFAAIWNDRDDAQAWVAEYSRIVEGDRGPDGSGADSGRAAVTSYGDAFGAVDRSVFRHSTGTRRRASSLCCRVARTTCRPPRSDRQISNARCSSWPARTQIWRDGRSSSCRTSPSSSARSGSERGEPRGRWPARRSGTARHSRPIAPGGPPPGPPIPVVPAAAAFLHSGSHRSSTSLTAAASNLE